MDLFLEKIIHLSIQYSLQHFFQIHLNETLYIHESEFIENIRHTIFD